MDILAALPKTPGMAPETLWAWLKRNGKVHPQELIRYKTTKLADPHNGHTGKICSLQLHGLRGIVAHNNSIAGRGRRISVL